MNHVMNTIQQITKTTIYQLCLPIERLSTVALLWDAYEHPCDYRVRKVKTEDCAVVELTDMHLAARIVKDIPSCLLKEKQL